MASSSTPPASNLPQLHKFFTGHNKEGKAVVTQHDDLNWQHVDKGKMGFSVAYTTSQTPPDLNDDKDLAQHNAMNLETIGLVNPGGSVLRYVEFEPGYACDMHRTQSLDYGIVLEGSIEMVLDSGERYDLKRGDVAVQRATQHQWVNKSQTEWARMVFILQDIKPLFVGGKEMGEDLGSKPMVPLTQR
jgi:quercetin dioxygenase-like cupin family protein